MLGAEHEAIDWLILRDYQAIVFCVEHDRPVVDRYRCNTAVSVVSVESFLDVEAVIAAGARNNVRPDIFIACNEFAVTTAALLNEAFGLESRLPLATAIAGRDKSIQKTRWDEAGIPTAKHAVISRRDGEVLRFDAIESVAAPYVLKPVAGGGAQHVAICQTTADLERAIAQLPSEVSTAMVEEYQAGEEWHFDGVIVDGEVVHCNVSRYLTPLVETTLEGALTASVSYSPSTEPETCQAAYSLAQGAVAALGALTGTFHLEAFDTDGGFVAGELGWRPPGGLGSYASCETIGVSLWAAHVAVHLGREVDKNPISNGAVGFVCLPVQPGGVNTISDADIASWEGVEYVRQKIPVGQKMPKVAASPTSVAWALVRGESVEHCRSLILSAAAKTNELHRRSSANAP